MIAENNKFYPDIFLAGTPKSGTSFLFDLLIQHPGILGATSKEPFFHVDDDNPYQAKRKSSVDYLKHFAEVPGEVLNLDGTTQTIYQNQILEDCKYLQQKPKFVAILRQPADRIWSSYKYTSENLASVEGMSFSEYVDILLNQDFQRLQQFCRNKEAYFSLSHELQFSDYLPYLLRWRNVIGTENMHVLVFETLLKHPELYVQEVFSFLGLDAIPIAAESSRTNSSQEVRNKKLHFVLRSAANGLGIDLSKDSWFKAMYRKIQLRSSNPVSHHEEALEKLNAYFEPKRAELQNNFNLDLSFWAGDDASITTISRKDE